MKKYILNLLTQISAWIGIAIIIAAFFAPREYIVFLGIALIFTHDESLKNWIAKQSPRIKNFLEWVDNA